MGGTANSKNGGAEGDRTPDLCSAIAALSQLSYGPILRGNGAYRTPRAPTQPPDQAASASRISGAISRSVATSSPGAMSGTASSSAESAVKSVSSVVANSCAKLSSTT